MELDAVVADPAATQPGAGRDRAVMEPEQGDRGLALPRALDAHAPRLGVRRFTEHPDITTDVDAHSLGAEPGELLGHEVRGEPLADPAGVEPDPDGNPHGARVVVDLDAVRAGEQRGSDAPGLRPS